MTLIFLRYCFIKLKMKIKKRYPNINLQNWNVEIYTRCLSFISACMNKRELLVSFIDNRICMYIIFRVL